MTEHDGTELPPATLARAPFVVDTPEALADAVTELSAGSGPFGVDAERASGFRYSARAYLVQVSRRGGGTHLIDPVALPNLESLAAVMAQHEWIIHAATQDLSCLREVGLSPTILFDTELGARLAGMPRVGLATVVAELLGLHLAKEHSAADWSTRPLPDDWLNYAALDVELLPDLRDALGKKLDELGKSTIAAQEFDSLTRWEPSPPREDPWRRLSGIPALPKPRNLAVARELWLARDQFAREADIGPGRVIPDRAILAAALALPATRAELASLKEFSGRYSRRELPRWAEAIKRGLTTEDLPPMRLRGNSLSTPRNWRDRHPDAYARYVCTREALVTVAEKNDLPVENLVSPDTVRRLCFTPPEVLDTESVTLALRAAGARSWQIEETAAVIAECFSRVEENPDAFLAAKSDSVD